MKSWTSGKITRRAIAGIIAFEVLVYLGSGQLVSRAPLFGSIIKSALAEITNEKRMASSLKPLAVNQALAEAAQHKAEDMAAREYFAHVSPEGKTPWDFLDKAGYAFTYAGENLAVNFTDSEDVVRAWVDSSAHRENLFNAAFREVGFGVASGKYKGRQAVFVVQFFGAPAAPRLADIPAAELEVTRTDVIPENKPQLEVSVASSVPEVAGVRIVEQAARQITARTARVSERVVAAPRAAAAAILYVLGGLVIITLLFRTLMKFDKEHPQAVFGCAMVIIAVGTALIINQHLFLAEAAVR